MPLYDLRKQTISSVRRSAGAHIVDSVRLASKSVKQSGENAEAPRKKQKMKVAFRG